MHAPNTDVAIYVAPNGAPNAPDKLIRGALLPRWRLGNQVNDFDKVGNYTWKFDSILEVLSGTDIRDGWPTGAPVQYVYVPNAQGQQYKVIEVEAVRVLKGKDYLRVYLQRTTWGAVAMEVKQASGTPDYLNITTLIIDQANGLTLSQPGAGQAQIAALYQMSIAVDASGLKLAGDSASPGNNMLYGTNASGVKGWYAQPGGVGANYPGWVKIVKSYSDFAIAGTSNTLTINTLPAKGVIHGAILHVATAFAGGALMSYQFTLAAGMNNLISGLSGMSAGNYQYVNTQPSYCTIFSFTTTTPITLQATSAGANLNAATQGSVEAYLLLSTLP
jgi:hypothetical protein